MIIKLTYNLAQLHEAAKFIWENNDFAWQWNPRPHNAIHIMDSIKGLLQKVARENAKVILKERKLGVQLDDHWTSITGTGGYYVWYELLDEDDIEITIGATILVDPAVSNPPYGYRTEIIDIN